MKMVKLLLLLPVTFILLSCDLEFNPFYKYTTLVWINSKMSITELDNNNIQIEEHNSSLTSTGLFTAMYDGTSLSDFSGGGSGLEPDFNLPPAISDQVTSYPLYMISHYFQTFFNPIDFTGSTSTIVPTVTVPYAADINGLEITNQINATDFPTPGNLSVIDLQSDHIDSIWQGTGQAILHSGDPNGVIYFYFHHDLGFTSYFYQSANNSNSIGNYFGEMDVEYMWTMFSTIAVE